MKRIRPVAFGVGALTILSAARAGVITSIQRLDGDITPNFSEVLVPNGMKPAQLVWSDSTFLYGSMPTYLPGNDYIRTVTGDNVDPDYKLQLNLAQTSVVYLIVDDRNGNLAQTMPWVPALGFTDTGDNIIVADRTNSIYSGIFSGQVVLQQQNSGTNVFGMYNVVAAPAQSQGNIVLTQSAQIGTAVIDSLTLQAIDQNVDLTQNPGTTLFINQGLITKNGAFSSTISGGKLATAAPLYNIAVNGGTLTVGSALTGQGTALQVSGAGVLELNSIDPANNFGGGIVVDSGTLRISDPRNLGGSATSFNTIHLNGGALETFQPAGTAGGMTLNNVFSIQQGGATFRPVSTSAVLRLLNDNQLQGTGSLTKDGAGVLVIGGANAYQGAVSVVGGTLELRNALSLGVSGAKSPITLADSTRLNLRSDQSFLAYGNSIVLTGNSAIDVGRLSVPGGGDFVLGALSVAANPNGSPTTLRITNASNDGSALHFIDPVTLNGTGIFETAGAATFLEGSVQGFGGLTKTGASPLTLTGATSNSFAGPTSVLQGLVALNKAQGAVAIPTDLFVNGGALRYDGSHQIADTSNVSLLQGLFNLNGQSDLVATLNISGGTFVTGPGKFVVTGPIGAPLPGRPLPAPPVASVVISGGTTTINPGGEINATSMQVSGGVNTVQASGMLTVGSGGLTLAGDLSPNISFLADATTPGRLNLSGNVTFTGLAGTASLDTSGAQPGLIDLKGAERTFTVNDGAASVDLRVSASVTNGALKKSGAGTLQLTGVNTYTGGTTISNGTIQINGGAALGSGPFVLNAGTLSVVSDAIPSFANVMTVNGDAGLNVDRATLAGPATGEVQFTGGLAIGASQLAITGANRSLRFTGSTTLTGTAKFNNTTAVNVTLSGAIGQASGTWGVTKDGVGTLTFDGASPNTYTGSTRINAGTLLLNKTAGQNAVAGNLDVFGGTVRLMAPNQIADTAAVTVSNPSSTLDLNGHSETMTSLNVTGANANLGGGGAMLVTQALNLTSGTLDLTNGALVVNYAPGGAPATFNAVKTAILSAYNTSGIHWTGTGITSSTARNNAAMNTGVGYAEASAVLGASGGMFDGQSVDGTAVLARYTLLGDATLDGAVDFNDLVKLAQNYNTAGTTWSGGDFTYDGFTDFNDLVKLAQSYNTTLPAAPIPGAPAGFEADLARAFASVPEPQTLALPGIGAGYLLARRRARNRHAN